MKLRVIRKGAQTGSELGVFCCPPYTFPTMRG